MGKYQTIRFGLLFCFVLLIGGTAVGQAPKLKKVLFIGNSYTAVNDLPNWVKLIGESAGDTFEVVSIAPGGTTFSMHLNNPQVTTELASGNYDAVVLQEQSQLPSFPLSQVESDCFPYAKALVDAARAGKPCIKVVFYMTWGRENGDAQNCASWPPVCKFGGMNELLRQRYVQMAKDNGCDVAPVASVWREVRNKSALGLYQGDGSHPSTAGTHLAALTIYRALTNKAVSTNLFSGPIVAADHKTIVDQVNFIGQDSASLWQYDTCYRRTASRQGDLDRVMPDLLVRWLNNNETLEVHCGGSTAPEVMVVDAVGRLVWQGRGTDLQGNRNGDVKSNGRWLIDASKWPSGMYYLRSGCGNRLIWRN